MDKIVKILFQNQDLKYRDFHSSLVPNVEKERFIGVRTPVLRKLAKEMVKDGSYKDFIKELPHYYYEENTLHSCILSLLKVKEWIHTKDIYSIRFGIVTLLSFYLDEFFCKEINEIVLNIKSDDYYVNMAIAWYFSYALIKQYDMTIDIFKMYKLDKWVHNKSIQKAIESFRISDDKKIYLRSLKVK